MLRRYPLAARLIVWLVVVVALALLVRRERGTLQDLRVNALNGCGVDHIAPYVVSSNPSLVEFTFGQEVTGITSLLDSTLTVGRETRPLFGEGAAWFSNTALDGPPHTPAEDVRYRLMRSAGPVRSATYGFRALPAQRTITLSFIGKGSPGVRLSEIVFPLTLLGFDIHPPGGDNVYAGTVRFATKNPWVILTNNRCTLLAWGRNLNAVSASWRPGVPRVVDILLHDRIDTGERGEINLTYLYGSSIRAESQDAVEAVIRQLERRRR